MSRIRVEDDDEPVSLVRPKRTAPIKYGLVRSRIQTSSLPNPCVAGNLNRIAAYLRRFQPEFRNANFYVYRNDGDQFYISDGGDDMYDGGNFTTPWLRSGQLFIEDPDEPIAQNVSYAATSETVTDGDFRYVSLGYVQEPEPLEGGAEPPQDASRHPLIVLGSRCSGPVGWQVAGNMGADGDGLTRTDRVYSGQTLRGFQVHAAVRQVWGQSDPVICNLILLIGASAWGSAFGPVSVFGDDDTNANGFYFYAGEGSRSVLAVHIVLSKPDTDNETPISQTEIKRVIDRFLQRLSEA